MDKKDAPADPGVRTRLAHGGHDPRSFHGFVNPPVVHASTVLFPDYATMKSRDQQYVYGTRGTPTTDALAHMIDEMEGSAGTILVPSGLAAISVPLLGFLSAGDHCLVVDALYNPTRRFCDNVLARMGIEIEYFDPAVGDGFANLLRENTKVVFLEAPGSNTFEMIDIPAIAAASHQTGAVVMIDNTWATPLFFRPLDHGVDISIHALTKYPSGHSDLVMGSASANEACWERLEDAHFTIGTCAQGDDCYAVLRGMRTLALRLAEHERNALKIAAWLKVQKQVAQVLHPALPDDPGYALWKRDFSGSSGLFSFVLKDAGEAQAAAFLDALQVFGLGYSWGGYESLAVLVNLEDRVVAKGPAGGALIRLQIGLEDTTDLIIDLERALKASGAG